MDNLICYDFDGVFVPDINEKSLFFRFLKFLNVQSAYNFYFKKSEINLNKNDFELNNINNCDKFLSQVLKIESALNKNMGNFSLVEHYVSPQNLLIVITGRTIAEYKDTVRVLKAMRFENFIIFPNLFRQKRTRFNQKFDSESSDLTKLFVLSYLENFKFYESSPRQHQLLKECFSDKIYLYEKN